MIPPNWKRRASRAIRDHAAIYAHFRDTFWLSLANFGTQGSTFAANVLLARMLSPELFGEFALGLSFMQMIMSSATVAIPTAASKFVAELHVTNMKRASAIEAFLLRLCFVLAGVVIVAGWLTAPVVSRWIHLVDPNVLRVAAVAAGLGMMNMSITGILLGYGAFAALGLIGMASGAIYVVSLIIGAVAAGPVGALGAVLLTSVAQFAFLLLARGRITNLLHAWASQAYAARSDVVRFVVPGAISGLTAAPALWFAQSLLARSPGGVANVGTFLLAANLYAIPVLLVNMAANVGGRRMNIALGSGDHNARAVAERETLSGAWMAAGVGTLATLVLAMTFAYGLFPGKSHEAILPAVLILLAGLPFEAYTISLSQSIQADNRLWLLIRVVNFPRELILCVAALAFIGSFHILGLAAAVSIARLGGAVSLRVAIGKRS